MENKTQTSNKRQSKSSLDQGKKRISSPNQHHKRRTHALRTNKISISDKRLELINAQETDSKEVEDKPIKKILSSDIKIEQGKNIIYFAGTHPGTDESGTIKENQDSFSFIENVFGLDNCNIYSVMDGHGTNGHFVSQYIKTQAEEFFQNKENYFRNKNVEINLDNIQVRLQSKNFSLINKFYKKVNSELPDTTFDTHFSGSTCNLVFKLGNTIICSNTGDSRAIIIKENKNINSQNNNQININNNNINNHNNLSNEHEKKIYNIFCNYEVEQLSYDHKPENKEEKERILEKGGCVYQCEDGSENGGPFRVWVKGESYPGLAMSRSLGDEVAESVGVIPDPDCIVKNINSNYKYIVIASDGLFEYLNNEDIMNIINPFFLIGDANGACKELGKKAAEEWNKLTEERDDITFIILFIGNIHIKKETI